MPTCDHNLCSVPWSSATFPLHLCHMTVPDNSALREVAQIPASSWKQESQIYVAYLYSSMAIGELGGHSSSSSHWPRKKPQNHTEQVESVHLPHKFLELNSSTGEAARWEEGYLRHVVGSLLTLSCPQPAKATWKLLTFPWGHCLLSIHHCLLSYLMDFWGIALQSKCQPYGAEQLVWCPCVLSYLLLWPTTGLRDVCAGAAHRMTEVIQLGVQWSSSERVFETQRASCECTVTSSLSGLVKKSTWLIPATNSCIPKTQYSFAPLQCCSERAAAWCCPHQPLRVQAELLVLPARWAGGIHPMGAQDTWLLNFTEIPHILVAGSLSESREGRGGRHWQEWARPEGPTKRVLSPQATNHRSSDHTDCCWRVMRHQRQVRQPWTSHWESRERVVQLSSTEHEKPLVLPLHSQLTCALSCTPLEGWKK